MSETARSVLDFAHQRLRSLLSHPDAWGAPESVELQMLLLLEVRQAALGFSPAEIAEVQRRYAAFLHRQYPGPPVPLAIRLGIAEGATPLFVSVLRDFIKHEFSRTEPLWPARSDQEGSVHYVGH